jgi:hypothetical protein
VVLEVDVEPLAAGCMRLGLGDPDQLPADSLPMGSPATIVSRMNAWMAPSQATLTKADELVAIECPDPAEALVADLALHSYHVCGKQCRSTTVRSPCLRLRSGAGAPAPPPPCRA